MLSTREPPVRPATLAEEFALEMKYRPTHVITESGIEPVTAVPVAPDPVQIALMEEPEVLVTGAMWSAAGMAGQIDILAAVGLPADLVGAGDVLDVFTEQTRLWLRGWQMQVNTGSCWGTSGSIGRQANDMIQAGYLLWSNDPVKDWVGYDLPTRTSVMSGTPGSAAYVNLLNGPRYLTWISVIR